MKKGRKKGKKKLSEYIMDRQNLSGGMKFRDNKTYFLQFYLWRNDDVNRI